VTPRRYQPFWCEENIWHLAQDPATAGDPRFVVVLTGAAAQVACWQQKAGAAGAPILWDYHVVLAVRTDAWKIWDLDGRLGCPVDAHAWLDATFPYPPLVPARFQPRFGLIPANEYVRTFGSDRAHMRDANGGWQQPPPAWPPIEGHGLTLTEALRRARQGLDLSAVTALWA
jgi:hypothetical protein